MEVKEGIVLYDIERDGCLNGVYTNDNVSVQGTIYNELARLKPQSKLGEDGITGEYDSLYFEIDNERVEAELRITHRTGNVFDFRWTLRNGTRIFNGVGYRMNSRQIAVHYVETMP